MEYVEDQMRNTKINKGPEDNEKALQELKETGQCSIIQLEKMNLNALAIRKRVQNIYDMKRQAASPSKPSREEVDSRSVFVGNVKYCCTIDELDQHFQSCGTVKKVTVGTDLNGKSRGFAFVEFLKPEAVQKALLLSESILHGRQLKVSAKRTNIPGMRQSSGSQHFIHSTGYRSKICLDPIKESLVKLEKKYHQNHLLLL